MIDGFNIGPIRIHFYGILIMLGALAAAWLADLEAKRRNLNREVVWDSLAWLLIGGIIGARIWHILTPPPSMVAQGITTMFYLTHPLDALAVWNGGLGIPGAVIGGAIALLIYTQSHKLNFLQWTDAIMPGLALAQAVGRWGNFINQELYGAPTTLPWAIKIDLAHRLPGFMEYETYHPLFLYESILNLINMGVLLWLGRRFPDKLKNGDLLLAYLVMYPTYRFLLEFLRLDASQVGGLNFNQTFMGIIAILAAGTLIWRHWPKQKTSSPAPQEEEASS
jgi:phosphatidylglycerol---prolipoprotein diacylglyceryl transferase